MLASLLILYGLTPFLTLSCSIHNPWIKQRSPETPETISYTEALSNGQKIFSPTLLIGWYNAPTKEQIPPSASDLIKYCTTDYFYVASSAHPNEKFYPVSPRTGELVCETTRANPEWRHSWPIIYWLNENKDSWCCQTTEQCKSITTYWGATAGLCEMKDWCVRCESVAYAVDEIMAYCRDGGGKYVWKQQGRAFGVMVGPQEDRDLSQ